jgi:hypothetical protein
MSNAVQYRDHLPNAHNSGRPKDRTGDRKERIACAC